MGNEEDLVDSESFPTPQVAAGDQGDFELNDLVAYIGIDIDTHEAGGRDGAIANDVASTAGENLMHSGGSAYDVGVLVEAELHSDHEVVRVAAAISALDTTGLRPRIESTLIDAMGSDDVDIVQMAATGLARINPQHEAIAHLTGPTYLNGPIADDHETIVITHGTWASGNAWYQPGGGFYDYIAVPRTDLVAPSFTWSGDYSDTQRQADARELVDWLAAQGIDDAPDFMAHSHGATVANLATQQGQQFHKLVFLSWPVHGQWGPDPLYIDHVVDIRVRMDLVVMADRGGQRIRNAAYPVDEHRNGWFAHSATHDPGYWDQHGLVATL